MIAKTTECSLCGALATYRIGTRFKHLYRCSKGHTTAIMKMAAELYTDMKTAAELEVEAPPRARGTDVETSHQAAAWMTEEVGVQHERILLELAAGPMTADQLDELIDWRLTTAGRRLPELRDAKRVRMLEATGKTRSGRSARLWRRCSDG